MTDGFEQAQPVAAGFFKYEDNRNCSGRRFRRHRHIGRAACDQHCHLTAHKISRQCWQSSVLVLGPAIFDRDVPTLNITCVA